MNMKWGVAASVVVLFSISTTEAYAAAYWTSRGTGGLFCNKATWGKVRAIPGVVDDCGGQAYTWCQPPGTPLIQQRCGSPARALQALMAAYYAKHGAKEAPAKQKQTLETQQPQQPAQAAAQPQPSAVPNQQSGSCSDITGTGGGGGPGNCAPSSGVPANIQQQMTQAQSYMQAAQTVQQSDPTYNGWSTAAAQYRKAAATFQAAGAAAQAAAAAAQAQTLETALKIANRTAGQVGNLPPSNPGNTSNSKTPKAGTGSANNTPCSGDTSNGCTPAPQPQQPGTPNGSPGTPGTGKALPVPPTVPAPTAGQRPGNTSVGVVCNSATGQGCGQPPAAPQFPGSANGKAPSQRTETATSTNEEPGPLEQLEKRSGEIYLPNIQPPPTATSPSVSTGTGTGTATTTNPAPAPATPTAPTTGPGTPKSPPPQQPPLDVQNCPQGASFYVAVVINTERAKLGRYPVTNACRTREVKVQLKTADVSNKVSTAPEQVPANGSVEVDSYNGKVPEIISACFVGSPGC